MPRNNGAGNNGTPPLPPSALWSVRDDRTLSEHAKIAYVMLWTRGTDIRPSMRTLAADMGVSVRTARCAVRELEQAGALKTVPRLSGPRRNDSNQYELLPVLGEASPAVPPALSAAPPAAGDADEDRTMKIESEGRNSLASRRARPAVTRAEVIHFVRRAITISYGSADSEDITDGQAVALWYLLINNRRVADPVAYLGKIFEETPDLNTHLANAGTEEDWDAA